MEATSRASSRRLKVAAASAAAARAPSAAGAVPALAGTISLLGAQVAQAPVETDLHAADRVLERVRIVRRVAVVVLV